MGTANRLRIVFAGTPAFAAHHLQGLLASNKHTIVGVYTQPDRRAGRGKVLTASPVKTVALKHNLPVFQPSHLQDATTQATLRELNADLMVVVAYGLLLPRTVLDIPRLGCINVHASLLPRWRGAAPIERAIEAGDSESGVTIMQMDAGLDTGDILLRSRCPIASHETGGSLQNKLVSLGVPALKKTIDQLARGMATCTKQNDALSCYAPKITKAETALDWAQPANVLERKIRAFNPFWVCHTMLHSERIKIWEAQFESDMNGEPGTIMTANKQGIFVACGQGGLRLTFVQLPGGKVLDSAAVINAKAKLFLPGARFATITWP